MSQQLTVEDFCKHRLTEEGTYRAFPVARTVETKDTGAIAIAWKFAIAARWHGKEQGWSEPFPIGFFCEGRTWIVKKDKVDDKGKKIAEGGPSESAIKALQACGLWDGDWDKLDDSYPVPQVYVLIDVEKEDYDGREFFRANWINPDAAEPKPRGQFAPVDKGLLANLRSRYQAKTRAIAGGGGPQGQPPAPPGFGAAPVVPGTPPAPAAPAAAAPAPAHAPSPFAPPGAQPIAPPQPPPWGGTPPMSQPTPPPGQPGMPPAVAVDPEKPPF